MAASGSTSLRPEHEEQYRRDGYVRLSRCFEREFAADWVQRALRRLTDSPETFDKDWQTSPAPRRFVADDPSTWCRPQYSILNDEVVPMADRFPSVWATLCSLLGGAQRIRTDFWTNYLILNPGKMLGHPRPWQRWWRSLVAPKQRTSPKEVSWHIDDPRSDATIESFHNGAVVFGLFTDVLPHGGGTALLLDSPAVVSRYLRAHPEGVDLSSEAFIADVVSQCRRVEYLEGEVGDVVVAHPFMLHSRTVNWWGPRWIANPNIQLSQTMRLDRPASELSVLESATREWCEG